MLQVQKELTYSQWNFFKLIFNCCYGLAKTRQGPPVLPISPFILCIYELSTRQRPWAVKWTHWELTAGYQRCKQILLLQLNNWFNNRHMSSSWLFNVIPRGYDKHSVIAFRYYQFSDSYMKTWTCSLKHFKQLLKSQGLKTSQYNLLEQTHCKKTKLTNKQSCIYTYTQLTILFWPERQPPGLYSWGKWRESSNRRSYTDDGTKPGPWGPQEEVRQDRNGCPLMGLPDSKSLSFFSHRIVKLQSTLN